MTVYGVKPVFRCMKIVSHRRAPQDTEVIQNLSVSCGALRWLFIHVKPAVGRFSQRVRINGTRMPRIGRIDADRFGFYPRRSAVSVSSAFH